MESLEKQSLQNQFKSTTKKSSYGAFKKETKSYTLNLKHQIEKGETLEGIALKYGISVRSCCCCCLRIEDLILSISHSFRLKILNVLIDYGITIC